MACTVLDRPTMKLWLGSCAALVLATAACGSAPPPVVSAPEAPVIEKIDRGATSVEGELGGMNEDAVAETFAKLQDPILACVADGATRLKELGGHFAISLRVDRQGAVRWAFLTQSTLGDLATEKCVLDVARSATWPKPLGGEGLAQRSFDVDASVTPIEMKAEKMKTALRQISRQAARCKKGATGRFVATAYLRPDGRVKSAGVAPPSADHQEAADCVAEVVQGARLASPGRRAAKITFEI